MKMTAFLCCFVVAFLLAAVSNAATHTWSAIGPSGTWATATNWSPAGVPANDWDAVFDDTFTTATQTAVMTANSTVNTLTIAGSGPKVVKVQKGVTLNALSRITVGDGASAIVTGTLATGGTLQLNGLILVELGNPGVTQVPATAGVAIAPGAVVSISLGTPPAAGAHLFPIMSSANGTVARRAGTVRLPPDDALGRRFSILYESSNADGTGTKLNTVRIGLARPGDANFDGNVSALNLLRASPLFGLTQAQVLAAPPQIRAPFQAGRPANWREGNWNDTGSSKGVVDAQDLLDASPYLRNR